MVKGKLIPNTTRDMKRKRKPITQGIGKKAFHKILEKAAQPVKKQDEDK